MKFGTKVIHAGIEPDPSTGAIMTPIFQTSTYVQSAPGEHQGYAYARTKNPTRSALEANLAALENGKYGFCFGSGMAAMDTLMKLLKPGDEVICTNDIYGGSYRLLTKVYQQLGIVSHFVNMKDLSQIEAKINNKTRLIWIETPTNPMLTILDVEAICGLANKHNIWSCVDNTFASPYLQNPLDMGATIVLHSATKYIGGHSDVVHGCLITSDDDIADQLGFMQKTAGAVPGPQDCFLVLRGIKTLHVRMDRACSNASKIAKFLNDHPKVNRVHYPGLESHPGHELAKKQMRDFGAMMSFDLKKDSVELAYKLMSTTRLFALAESLGGVESLIGHPASMTHASIPREERLKSGLTDTTIRLSVGIEDVEDLIADLSAALDQV